MCLEWSLHVITGYSSSCWILFLLNESLLNIKLVPNWVKKSLNIGKCIYMHPEPNLMCCVSSSSTVGHAALPLHHPSHSQHWRSSQGQEVHRGFWDGGLRVPRHPAPPLPSPSKNQTVPEQPTAHPISAALGFHLSTERLVHCLFRVLEMND